MPSPATIAPTVQQSGESASVEVHSHGRHRHRRRQKPRSFYDKWIRPHRRELKTGSLFCLCVVLGYLLWTAAIAR